MRSVDEWIGKTDDSPVPDRVKIRIFDRYHGRCYLSDRKILPTDKWQCEHIIAIANGGQNRESNLAPALIEPHKVKTKADRRVQSKIYKIRKRHLGLKRPKGRPIPGTKASGWKRRMDGTIIRRDRHE